MQYIQGGTVVLKNKRQKIKEQVKYSETKSLRFFLVLEMLDCELFEVKLYSLCKLQVNNTDPTIKANKKTNNWRSWLYVRIR